MCVCVCVSLVHGWDEVMAVTHIVSSDTAEMRGSQEEELGDVFEGALRLSFSLDAA